MIGPGAQLGPYRLEAELARGGQGAVFRGIHVALGRPVAIKVLLDPDPATRKRFLLEARVLVHLEHPGVVGVEALAEEAGFPYLVMTLLSGQSLKERVRTGGPLGGDEACQVLASVCEALDYCHQRGVLHRDLKPDNVLVTDAGVPVIVDFGLAKHDRAKLQVPELEQTRLSASGELKGTPAYMAPEQAGGEDALIGPATDVYALGGVLFFLLAGAPPFADSQSRWGLLKRVLDEEAPDLRSRVPQVPEHLAELCRRALAKDPDLRPKSALEFRAALFPQAAPVSPADPRAARAARWLLALGVLALGSLLAGGLLATRGSPLEEAPGSSPSPQESLAASSPSPPLGALWARFEEALGAQNWAQIRESAAALHARLPAERSVQAALGDACAAEGREAEALDHYRTLQRQALAGAGELPVGLVRSGAYQGRLSWSGSPEGGLEAAGLQVALGRGDAQLALLDQLLRRSGLERAVAAALLGARAEAYARRDQWPSASADELARAPLLDAPERAAALAGALKRAQSAVRVLNQPADRAALEAGESLLGALRAPEARVSPAVLAEALFAQAEAQSLVAGRRRAQENVAPYDLAAYRLSVEASDLEQRHAGAWFLRAVSATRLARVVRDAAQARALREEALASYEAALQLGGSLTNVLTGRGNLYEELGQRAAALRDFTRALELSPERKSFKMNVARLRGDLALEDGELEAALGEFKACEGFAETDAQIRRAKRDQGRVWALQATKELAAKRPGLALDHLRRAIDLDDRPAERARFQALVEQLERAR